MATQREHSAPELTADEALFEGKIGAIVVACRENERPLLGLAGLLDWRFQGLISSCISAGAISGKPGECVYMPVARAGRTYHLVLVGAGHSEQVPAESLRAVQKNLSSMKFESVGVSKSDFGSAGAAHFEKALKGISLCIVN
jgi:hypothetical protein